MSGYDDSYDLIEPYPLLGVPELPGPVYTVWDKILWVLLPLAIWSGGVSGSNALLAQDHRFVWPVQVRPEISVPLAALAILLTWLVMDIRLTDRRDRDYKARVQALIDIELKRLRQPFRLVGLERDGPALHVWLHDAVGLVSFTLGGVGFGELVEGNNTVEFTDCSATRAGLHLRLLKQLKSHPGIFAGAAPRVMVSPGARCRIGVRGLDDPTGWPKLTPAAIRSAASSGARA